MHSFVKTLLTLLPVLHMSASMSVIMSEPHIRVYDTQNISLKCRTKWTDNDASKIGLSIRARMVLTILKIPRNGQRHQVLGTLHCDPMRTNCESEFNIAVETITSNMQILQPMDTLESACQLVDDHVCSTLWLKQHRYDCVALGTITVVKG